MAANTTSLAILVVFVMWRSKQVFSKSLLNTTVATGLIAEFYLMRLRGYEMKTTLEQCAAEGRSGRVR